MAIVGLSHTLADLRKMLNPQGQIDQILEIMSQDNPILEDCPFMEGNLPTGNKTTVRASLPTPSVRRINKGIDPSKGTTKQITDDAMILEDRSQVDIELLAIAPNPQAYRQSEDVAHGEGMAQTAAAKLLYGQLDGNDGTFNGFFTRYNTLGGTKGSAGYQVIGAGAANVQGKNTSMLFVDWGDRRVTGIYPRGTQAGLKARDLGEMDCEDEEGKKFRGLVSLYTWKLGLAVHNVRSVARIVNIDAARIDAGTMTDAEQLKLVDKIIVAKNRIWKPKNPVCYVSETMYTFLEQYLTHKNNVHITRQELMGKVPQLYISGIPIKKVDCYGDEEAAVQ